MGQANGKSFPLALLPSTGPDSTLFRSQPSLSPLPTSQPTFTPPRDIATGDTSPRSNNDNITGNLPLPPATVMAKSKNMVRKLSKKAGFRRIDGGSRAEGFGKVSASNTLEDDLKAFESLVLDAEARTPTVHTTSIDPSKTIKAGTAKRMSVSDGSPIPFPSALPAHVRPGTHHRSSTTSIHSGRTSIKSAHRAEREWRARVAGLARGGSRTPRSSVVDVRGPVPPRRTPGPQRSPSPEDDTIVTPPPPELESGVFRTRNRSFETLGHPPHLREADESPLRDRKASVPHSISSFYFETDTRGNTRPPSLAASQLLPSIPPSPVTHRASLPPFDNFLSSLTSVCGTPKQNIPSLLPSETAQKAIGLEEDRGNLEAEPTMPTRGDLPGDLRSAWITSSPVPIILRRNGIPLDCLPFNADQPESQRHLTPQRPISLTPSTPYSPVTAFILTAPIDQIPWTMEDPTTPQRVDAHPYAIVQADWRSPPPPTPPSKSSLKPMYTIPIQPHDHDTSFDPFTAPPPVPRRPIGLRNRSNSSIPAALKPRRTVPRVEVLGTGHSDGYRPGVDLTPGRETGNRPPKSGLPNEVSTTFYPWMYDDCRAGSTEVVAGDEDE